MRDQVYFQQGFSVHEVDVITRESFDAGEEMLDFEIPWVALAMAGARTFLRYRAGGTTLSNAVARCAVEWATRSALGTAGAPLAQVAGLILFGPAGGVVLGGVGAVVGVSLGHKVVDIGAALIARGEKRAAAGAVRELLVAGARALDRKVHAFTQRRVTTEQALTAHRPPAAVAALFQRRLDREVRDHDHSRNELRYYAAKVEELGSGPIHWATRSFDLLHRAAVLPYSVQAETGKVLEMVDVYRRRLKNPLPDLDSLVAAVRPT